MSFRKRNYCNLAVTLGGLSLAAMATFCSGSAAPGIIPAIGGVLAFLGGMAGNQGQKWLSDLAAELPPDPEDVFRNHHIRDTVSEAVATVIRTVAGRNGSTLSGTMQEALRVLPAVIGGSLQQPNSPIARLGEFNIPDILTEFAGNKGRVTLLTIEEWDQFLAQPTDQWPARLWPDERNALATAMHERLAEALWNHVKFDASHDGQGYAAVELLYLSRILRAVEQRPAGTDAPESTALIIRVTKLIGRLDQKQSQFFEKLFAQNCVLLDLVRQQERVMEKLPDNVANRVVTALKEELATKGQKPADLSQEQLEGELAARVPNLKPEDLHRLIGYALFKADISRFDISKYHAAPPIGRDDELKLLDEIWQQAVDGAVNRPNVFVLFAWGGQGKTAIVGRWTANLVGRKWQDCDAVFAWSFQENNAELFFERSLTFFGEETLASSAASSIAKGQRLAELFGERRSLLVLDGLERLQHGPASPMRGELREPGMAAMLKSIATAKRGLCLVTTQYPIAELGIFSGGTVLQKELPRLSRRAGVELLQTFGVRGSPEQNIPFNNGKEQLNKLEKLVEDVHGHALTLNLFGSFLRDFYAGDIRRRDQVNLKDADAESGGHASRVMDAYVQAFKHRGKSRIDKERGEQALALLELLGLFDRPTTIDCLTVLWTGKPIRGLTKPFFTVARKWCGLRKVYHPIDEAQRRLLLTRLEDARLLTTNWDEVSTQILAIDIHPLVRDYFAQRVQGQRPAAWRAAHRRIYEHLCKTTQEGDQPTLEDLQPLYQAIFHGCQANLKLYALADVYQKRLLRRQGGRLEHYTWHTLGAYASELGVLACFFDRRWSCVAADLPTMVRTWLFNEVGYCLQASGRLMDALEPLKKGASLAASEASSAGAGGWRRAAIAAWNLSDLNADAGDLAEAMRDAERSVIYAERSAEVFPKVVARTTHANTLYLTGRWAAAEALFREAEAIQQRDQSSHGLLFSSSGFHYCELLLADSERYAWLTMLGGDLPPVIFHMTAEESGGEHSHERVFHSRELTLAMLVDSCRAVFERAGHTLRFYEQHVADLPLDIARNHLTRGCAASYQAILQGKNGDLGHAISEFTVAINGLRRANNATHIPRGLISRALLRAFEGKLVGVDSAQGDLNEAWEIAARGPMPLLLADIHLARARLFFRERSYPWSQHANEALRTAADDISAARRLIEHHEYGRRKCELEDAETAIKTWLNANA